MYRKVIMKHFFSFSIVLVTMVNIYSESTENSDSVKMMYSLQTFNACKNLEHIQKKLLCIKDEHIQIISKDPFICLLYDIITDEEAEHLKAAAMPKMKRSMVGTGEVSKVRTSSSAMFALHETEEICKIEKRISSLCECPVEHIEGLQVVWYKTGEEFKPHYDYLETELKKMHNSQRFITCFIYLNDVEFMAAGETVFPKLDIKIRPKKNMGVLWFNVDYTGKEDERMLHGGAPVLQHEKWGVNVWIHNKPYTGNGINYLD